MFVGGGDKDSIEYTKVCTELDSIKTVSERERRKFMDRLLRNVHFSNLLIVHGWNLLCHL